MHSFKTIGLFRCTEKKYADLFCKNGTIKFGTPRTWIDLEKSEGKGRGDSKEGISAIIPCLDYDNIVAFYNMRPDTVGEMINEFTYFRSNNLLDLPCFCLFGLHNTHFSEITTDKKGILHYTATIAKEYFNDFSENTAKESINKLPEEKQPVVIIITNPHEFFCRIKSYFYNLGVKDEEIIISPVIYKDMSSPFVFYGKFPNELLLKDIYFSHQSEVRIILNTRDHKILQFLKQNNNIINLGCLKDITHIEKFYFTNMTMELQENKLLYTLPEPRVSNVKDFSYSNLISLINQISRGDAPGIETEEEIKKNVKYLCTVIKEKFNVDINPSLLSNEIKK